MAEKLDAATIGAPAREPGTPSPDDAPDGLTAVLRFRSVDSGDAPIGKNLELAIALDGFRDTSGIGGAGDRAHPISVQAAAALLVERFDRDELERLLSHVADLHAALR